MIKPQPPRLRMKRRNTVSVTPAMGARTVAGVLVTLPMERLPGTGFSGAASRAKVPAAHDPELSQNFFTVFYSTWPVKRKPPPKSEGRIFWYIRDNPRRSVAKIYFFASSGFAAAGSFFAYL